MLIQTAHAGFRIGEISCPTRYFPEASSINFTSGMIYGLGVLRTAVTFRLQRMGLVQSPLLYNRPAGRLAAPAQATSEGSPVRASGGPVSPVRLVRG